MDCHVLAPWREHTRFFFIVQICVFHDKCFFFSIQTIFFLLVIVLIWVCWCELWLCGFYFLSYFGFGLLFVFSSLFLFLAQSPCSFSSLFFSLLFCINARVLFHDAQFSFLWPFFLFYLYIFCPKPFFFFFDSFRNFRSILFFRVFHDSCRRALFTMNVLGLQKMR